MLFPSSPPSHAESNDIPLATMKMPPSSSSFPSSSSTSSYSSYSSDISELSRHHHQAKEGFVIGAAVVQWTHACFGILEVSKCTGSNPVHGLSVGWASSLGATVS
ncbi:hypothetical protein E2C01_074096 [Portunus trituberculatus]|uniref:Uncharacterized protein n=1 Tax=Portunus trituberculatus TaxID=210409 RepID=A0A5B7IG15_PORTR|nr:hypothetical protein [Portunus trituberculatus]